MTPLEERGPGWTVRMRARHDLMFRRASALTGYRPLPSVKDLEGFDP